MVKYFEIHNCRECPLYGNDNFWGKEVCTYEDIPKDINPDEVDIPDWCPLDGPNDL